MVLHSSVESTQSSDSDSDGSSKESVEESGGSGNEGTAEKVSYSRPYADVSENEGVVVLSDDDISVDDKVVNVWENPSTSVIIECTLNKSADEVMLMKPGSNKLYTFSLLNEKQRNDAIDYVSNPEPGSKWRLWPGPAGEDYKSIVSNAIKKEASAKAAKRAESIAKFEGANECMKSPSKKDMFGNEFLEEGVNKKTKRNKNRASKQNADVTIDAGDSVKGKQKNNSKSLESKDEDDSVDDLFGGEDLGELLAAEAKTRKQSKPLQIHVSRVIEDVELKLATVVALYDPGPAWYEKAEHIQTMVIHLFKKKNPGEEIPSWMRTIKNINIRAEQHGLSSLFKRRPNNSTIQYVMFVFQVPLESKALILKHLATSVQEQLIVPFFKRKRNTAGQLTLKYVDTLPKGSKGGLLAICLSKGAGDRDEAAAKMTEELNDFYAGGASFVHGFSLDKFLVDYDMKMFAMESLGVESWDAMCAEWKSIFFKNYPSRVLPKWDKIMEQGY